MYLSIRAILKHITRVGVTKPAIGTVIKLNEFLIVWNTGILLYDGYFLLS